MFSKNLIRRAYQPLKKTTFFNQKNRAYSSKVIFQEPLFDAIRSNDVPGVKNWYQNQERFFDQPIEEAALDLANQQSHPEIIQIIKDNTIRSKAKIANNVKDPVYKLYKRTGLAFDRSYPFKEVALETNRDSSVELFVYYRTHLELPFLKQPLMRLGARDHTGFQFLYPPSIPKKLIKAHIEQVFLTLIKLSNEDNPDISLKTFSPIKKALKDFFKEAKKGLASETNFNAHSYKPNTYEGYQLFCAAKQCDVNKMYELLCAGANPNTRFSYEQPILFIATTQNMSWALEGTNQEKEQRVIELIELLIATGANPSLEFSEFYKETLTEQIIRLYPHVNDSQQALYLRIMKHLTASPYVKPHVKVHPSLKYTDLGRAVLETNEALLKTPYILELRVEREILRLTMADHAIIEIVSRDIKSLKTEEKEELADFFASKAGLNINDKTLYLEEILNTKVGQGIVDFVRHDGVLKAFFISELIHTEIKNKSAFIYHAKLAVATLPKHYPGLMKFLIWIRGVAYRHEAQMERYFYFEAASSRGFANAYPFMKASLLPFLNDIIPELIEAVNQGKKYQLINGLHYIPDEMTVKEDESINPAPSLPLFFREFFKKKYSHAGQDLAVAFRNDRESTELFEKSVVPYFGEKSYKGLFSYYQKTIPAKESSIENSSQSLTR